MHEYRRLVQSELDARGWQQAMLVRQSGLSRQMVSKILRDDRDHLGQMPDDSTMQALADGFGIPVDRVRKAAARSLVGYTDDGEPLTADLTTVSIDALLNEIRRRVNDLTTQAPSTPGTTTAKGEKTGAGSPRKSDEAQPDPLDLAADNAVAHIKSGQDGSENDEVGDAS